MLRTLTFTILGLWVGGGALASDPVQVRGAYLEARTADVFTGPCFSNSEVFIVGDRAVMAWKVDEGTFHGAELAGLSVAAALKGTSTFSEDRPEAAEAVLIVDAAATTEQRAALIALARELGGARLGQIVDVRSAPIELNIEAPAMSHAGHHASESEHVHHNMPQAPRAEFRAGDLAEIATRPLDPVDCICGNEVVAYPPLSKGVEALPAYTLGHAFTGKGLGSTWNDPNARSAFVGSFAL